MRSNLSLLFLIASFLMPAVSSPTCASNAAFGTPWAIMKIEIPAKSDKLCSIPFVLSDTSIDSIFNGQLTGNPDPALAD